MVELRSFEAYVSKSNAPPSTCNEVCISPRENPLKPSTKNFNAKSKGLQTEKNKNHEITVPLTPVKRPKNKIYPPPASMQM